MELEDATYLVVVHKTSSKGKITSQVEKFKDDKSSALANAEGEVMVLTTKKGIRLSAFEMK